MKVIRPAAWFVAITASLVGAVFALADDGRRVNLNTTETIQVLNGSPQRIGQIVSPDGGTFNNWTTATPFDAGFGPMLSLVCSTRGHVANGTSSDTTANGGEWPVAFDEKYFTLLKVDENTIAYMPDAGSGTCQVYRLR